MELSTILLGKEIWCSRGGQDLMVPGKTAEIKTEAMGADTLESMSEKRR